MTKDEYIEQYCDCKYKYSYVLQIFKWPFNLPVVYKYDEKVFYKCISTSFYRLCFLKGLNIIKDNSVHYIKISNIDEMDRYIEVLRIEYKEKYSIDYIDRKSIEGFF